MSHYTPNRPGTQAPQANRTPHAANKAQKAQKSFRCRARLRLHRGSFCRHPSYCSICFARNPAAVSAIFVSIWAIFTFSSLLTSATAPIGSPPDIIGAITREVY